MKTSMKIYSLGVDDKTITTTLGFIRNDATDTQIKVAAQRLNSLTTNTYNKTEKITVTEVDVTGGDDNG